jgi:hypothetical protein
LRHQATSHALEEQIGMRERTWTLANLEAMLVLLTRSQVDEHIGSILRHPEPALQPEPAR